MDTDKDNHEAETKPVSRLLELRCIYLAGLISIYKQKAAPKRKARSTRRQSYDSDQEMDFEPASSDKNKKSPYVEESESEEDDYEDDSFTVSRSHIFPGLIILQSKRSKGKTSVKPRGKKNTRSSSRKQDDDDFEMVNDVMRYKSYSKS